ncbi:MAG: hypothetical protein QF578_19755 [Alphaproteobacteria bacterium]|nr:hypothetical protein [Alphaproteobacteria bacterium]MDP6811580.1 hypothetical protein [Alphaproteobacteria bacterium]
MQMLKEMGSKKWGQKKWGQVLNLEFRFGSQRTGVRSAPPVIAAARMELPQGTVLINFAKSLIKNGNIPAGAEEAAKQLREQTFKGREARALQARADGGGFEVGSWAG